MGEHDGPLLDVGNKKPGHQLLFTCHPPVELGDGVLLILINDTLSCLNQSSFIKILSLKDHLQE